MKELDEDKLLETPLGKKCAYQATTSQARRHYIDDFENTRAFCLALFTYYALYLMS